MTVDYGVSVSMPTAQLSANEHHLDLSHSNFQFTLSRLSSLNTRTICGSMPATIGGRSYCQACLPTFLSQMCIFILIWDFSLSLWLWNCVEMDVRNLCKSLHQTFSPPG